MLSDYIDTDIMEKWDTVKTALTQQLGGESLIKWTEVRRGDQVKLMISLPTRERYDQNYNRLPAGLVNISGSPGQNAPYKLDWFLQISAKLLVIPPDEVWRCDLTTRFDPTRDGRIELLYPTVWGANGFDLIDGKLKIDPTEIVVLHADHGVPAALFGFDFRLANTLINNAVLPSI